MNEQEIFLEKNKNVSYREEQLINDLIDDLIIDSKALIFDETKKYNIIGLKKGENKEVVSLFIKSLFSHTTGNEIVFFDEKKRNNFVNIKIKYEN